MLAFHSPPALALVGCFLPKLLTPSLVPLPSRDAFYSRVSAAGIQAGLKSLAEGGCAPRLLIIDDGWQQTDVDEQYRAAAAAGGWGGGWGCCGAWMSSTALPPGERGGGRGCCGTPEVPTSGARRRLGCWRKGWWVGGHIAGSEHLSRLQARVAPTNWQAVGLSALPVGSRQVAVPQLGAQVAVGSSGSWLCTTPSCH